MDDWRQSEERKDLENWHDQIWFEQLHPTCIHDVNKNDYNHCEVGFN